MPAETVERAGLDALQEVAHPHPPHPVDVDDVVQLKNKQHAHASVVGAHPRPVAAVDDLLPARDAVAALGDVFFRRVISAKAMGQSMKNPKRSPRVGLRVRPWAPNSTNRRSFRP